jgi:hypothetical protein
MRGILRERLNGIIRTDRRESQKAVFHNSLSRHNVNGIFATFCRWNRQRFKFHGVNHAEDCGVDADS